MAIDPSLQAGYLVQTPPLAPQKLQGMLISLMERRYRFCGYEPFANGDLEVGVFITGITDTTGKIKVSKPTAAGAKILGVSFLNFQRVMSWDDTKKYFVIPNDSIVSVIEEGDIVMYAEAPVSVGDSVFFRHTADSALTRIGAVAPATGTGLEQYVGNAQFLEKTTAPGLVRVNLRF